MKMIAQKYSNSTEYEEGQKKPNWNLQLVIMKENFPAYVVESNHDIFKEGFGIFFSRIWWVFFE